MPRPYASGVVPASAAALWELVRDFDGLPGWHPAIDGSELTGTEGTVGAIRRLSLGDGSVVVERLLTLDDAGRSYTYAFEGENPFGVRRYVSTLRVAEVTDTRHSFMEWWGEYDAEGAAEGELDELFGSGVYAAGIAALQERFTN